MRTYRPAVVVHISPSTGDDGAVPWGMRSEETPATDAARARLVVDDAAIPIALDAAPVTARVWSIVTG